MKSIEIQNSKAVQNLTLPWPDNGGLVVLRGYNGAGKSDTLEAVDVLLGGEGKLERTDGKPVGKVEGLGRTIRITAAGARKSGALEVNTLEDNIGIGDLIDPKEKSPAAADRKAMKALLRILKVKADPEKFFPLVGGEEEFRKLVNPEVFIQSDIVTMAAMVKRDIEQAARRSEQTEKNHRQDAAAELKAANGTDLSLPDDPKVLHEELERATRRREELKQQESAAIRSRSEIDKAKAELQKAKESYRGPTVEEAKSAAEEAKTMLQAAKQRVEDAQRALDEAKLNLAHANSAYTTSDQAHKNAEAYESLCQKWQNALDNTAIIEPPSDADLAGSLLLLEKAREAVDAGVKVRMAKIHKAKAEELNAKANQESANSEMFRNAAKGTEKVLSEILQESGGPIKVTSDDKDELRLVYTEHKRGEVFLSDLSHGERTALIVPMVIKAVGPGGGFTLPQTYYESLQPSKKKELAKMLDGSGVCCYTAESADCDIKAVVVSEQ
jgi:energy-coupling factor transporter ATP-binding protein EcfA2